MRSLRGRLTLGVTLVLAAVLLAAGLSVANYVEDSERETLDDRLRRTVELTDASALAAIQQELPTSDKRLDAVLRATGSSLRLLLGDTVLLESGRQPPSRPAAARGLRTFTADGRRYRVLTTTLDDKELGGVALLEVTTSLAGLEERQRDLEQRLGAMGLAVLLLAGVGTWFAADLVLRPLRRLRRSTAGIVGDEDLERRVPAGGPSEIRSLAESFNAMLARLQRSAASREQALAATRRFAADAGHELRTPLTSVLATLSALRRHPDVAAERREAMLDDALAENRRLVDLLDGLQSMARGDATGGPSEFAEIDLAELAADAAARHDAEAALPDAPVIVQGWEPGLRLVLDNLLENAARHGGGDVRLSLDGAGDGGPVLVVEDDGPGIPAAERERVFEPFARITDPDGQEVPGSGLGLALVAQQVRHHGGEVAIGDSPLGGARFEVRLPQTPAGSSS